MRAIWLTRAVRAVLTAPAVMAIIGVTTAAAEPVPERPRTRRALNLFAVTNAVMDVNRVFCGINNLGEICVDPTNSPVLGGGFWPKGSPDQYIFNSGLQIAGRIAPDAGFAWANDITGAFFFDARGTQVQGDAVTLVYNSLDLTDAGNWPNGAVVRDTALYSPVLIGRNSASQQDLWTRAWDGNPSLLSGRTHPMGILVEERGLAWNFPTGNEDIIYFIFRFYNISASDPSVYNNPSIEPEIRAEIAAVGAQFQARNEAAFGIQIPDGGYSIQELYAAFSMDPDVGDAGSNYATAILPFSMGLAYKSDFLEPDWFFPPEIFGAPFTPLPGFIGVKYLKSPVDPGTGQEVGLTMFSNTVNAATGFPDPTGVAQLYRYLSGTVSTAAGDNPCSAAVGDPIAARLCFLDQTARDTRFFQSSGPFTLAPGQAQTIVVAYVHAAPLPIQAILDQVGGDLEPGIPPSGEALAPGGGGTLRPIELGAGWVSHSDINTDGTITQDEVVTVPRSLLNKALVAQAVFNNKFLLPFAPDAPQFFLVPGQNEVTVVWRASESETVQPGGGDPYFEVASRRFNVDPVTLDSTPNPLYDPNFRQYDVEGYRIYRGRTTGQLELVAQFDYGGRTILDYTGGFAYPGDANGDAVANCAPELATPVGVTPEDSIPRSAPDDGDCPVTFPAPGDTIRPDVFAEHNLVGSVVQIPAGGRVRLANGSVLILAADTAVTGGGSAFPALTDAGVPFVYVDRAVRNSFRYFYAVTAFDVNSLKSGPSSLESPRIVKSVTPRGPSGQETAGVLMPQELIGGDGAILNPSAPLPTIDPATGIFAGPMPPTNGVDLGLAAFLPQLLGDGSVTLTIDSVIPGFSYLEQPSIYYMTAQGAGDPVQFSIPLALDGFDAEHEASGVFEATPVTTAKASRFGGDSTFSLFGETTLRASGSWKLTQWARANINAAPAGSDYNGPRWWAGAANENTPDPNGLQCPGSPGACVQADLSRNVGSLPGVAVLFRPHAYATVPSTPLRDLEALLSGAVRAADFRVYWGAAGVIDSVIDVVHRVPVPFSPNANASWGILNAASFAATTEATTGDGDNALLTWADIFCVDPAPRFLSPAQCGGPAQTPAALMNTAALSPIAATASTYANTATLPPTGNGFIFYLNGHYFLMQMASLPADGDVWNARFYSGTITGSAATADFAFASETRPAAVPGLRVRIAYQGSSFDPMAVSDSQLARVHTVPDPYYVTNPLEITANTKVLAFVNLPARVIIRIYSVSGILVQMLTHNDAQGGGEAVWNLRNRSNQFVASGVYFYHVETPDGKSKVGRFTVVNFAQ